MPIRLDTSAADFPERFRAFLATKREASQDVEQAVRAIIADVIGQGDRAVVAFSQKFDRVDLDKVGMAVTKGEIAVAAAGCNRAALDALKLARDRIEVYHRRQLPTDERLPIELGF